MKKFKYRAQSYLKFLLFKRQEALRVLKKAEAYRDKLMEHYAFLENRMREAFQFSSQAGKSGHNIYLVNDNNIFIKKIKSNLENLTEQIQAAEDEFQDKRKVLLDLQLKVKKMELHKEAELVKFKKEYKRKSQKLTDEINATRKRGQDAKPL